MTNPYRTPTPCPDCGAPGQIRDGRRWWCADCFQPVLWRDDEPVDEWPPADSDLMRTGNGLVVPRGYTKTSNSYTTTSTWKDTR